MGALNRAVKDVSRRKIRTFLVIIALSFSIAIMVSIPAGVIANQEATQNISEEYSTLISDIQKEINKTSTLIEVRASSGRPTSMPSGAPPSGFGQQGTTFINETVVDEIRSIEGVKGIVPFIEVSSEETTNETMNTPRGSFTISRPLYTIIGVPLNASLIESYTILPTNITAGRNLYEGDSGVLIISSNLSDYLRVSVGDKVEVYGEYFSVVGIYEPTVQTTTEARAVYGNIFTSQMRSVYMNISDLQRISDNMGNVSRLDVYAEDVSYVDGIAEVIKTAYPELYVTTYKDRLQNLERTQEMYQTTLENAESTLSQMQTVAFQEIVIVIVATSLIVLFTMLYSVRERTKEIGILKAIGFSNWNVMSQFMLEGILVSLIAGVVGIAMGIVGAPLLSSLLLPSVNPFPTQQQRFPGQTVNVGTDLSQSVTAVPDLTTILLVFGVAVALGAIGSLYPAWRAARTSPMEALRYE
ncbi:MAG: ABC transporter permease [Candidatus Bathyarchaeales archaeon]